MAVEGRVQAQIAWHIPILDHVNFFAFFLPFCAPVNIIWI